MMRIKDIEIEGYKSIRDQHLSPSSIATFQKYAPIRINR